MSENFLFSAAFIGIRNLFGKCVSKNASDKIRVVKKPVWYKLFICEERSFPLFKDKCIKIRNCQREESNLQELPFHVTVSNDSIADWIQSKLQNSFSILQNWKRYWLYRLNSWSARLTAAKLWPFQPSIFIIEFKDS